MYLANRNIKITADESLRKLRRILYRSLLKIWIITGLIAGFSLFALPSLADNNTPQTPPATVKTSGGQNAPHTATTDTSTVAKPDSAKSGKTSLAMPHKAAQKKKKKKEPLPARRLFGFVQGPAPLHVNSIGSYARGCLAGAVSMPLNGPAWQVMRPSRNRNWGHPATIAFLKKLATDVKEKDDWPGLLIGDISQPRGGPMLTGHASHQLGLDADIWMMGMPNRKLTFKEREETAAVSMLKGPVSINDKVFKPGHVRVLKRAASSKRVARIFVHPAIKKAVCEATQDDKTRAKWLKKLRPWYGHHYHFHVRLKCPAGTHGCRGQRPVPAGTGCGKPLNRWIARLTPRKRKPGSKPKTVKKKPVKKHKKRILTLARLPRACKAILKAGDPQLLANLINSAPKEVSLPERKPKM